MNRIFLTDKEVALVCEMSVTTVSRIAHGRKRKGAADITSAMSNIGGVRRWNVAKLALALGITVKELNERIS